MALNHGTKIVQQPLLSSPNIPPNYSVQANSKQQKLGLGDEVRTLRQNHQHVTNEQQDINDETQPLLPPPTQQLRSNTHSITNVRVWVLSLVCVICFVVVRVLLPIYSASTEKAGSDAFTLLFYICLWFPIVLAAFNVLHKAVWDSSTTLCPAVSWRVLWLIGALGLGNGFCATFASLPSRTPPYLQGLLLTMRIPFTVLARLAILKKGLSLRRLGCTVAVLIGIFITVEPQIWTLPGSSENGSSPSGGSAIGHVIWPFIFALGFLPAAISTVLCERELKHGEAQSLSFVTWTQIFQFLTILPLFWVDFIPYFGMAKSFHDFSDRMQRGFVCNFHTSTDCYGLVYKGWIFILSYCLGNLFQYLLIQQAEGAVFAVVVQAMVTPLATLFWTFFNFDMELDLLYWHPEFTETTAFTVGGLVIIVPAVVLYNVFSRWDAADNDDASSAERSEDLEDQERGTLPEI